MTTTLATIKTIGNKILGGETLTHPHLEYIHDKHTGNHNHDLSFYYINPNMDGTSGTIYAGAHTDSGNKNQTLRGNIFKPWEDRLYYNTEMKYNRQDGGLYGYIAVPDARQERSFLHGVAGIEFDWKLESPWGASYVKHFGITFANRNISTSKIFYMPLVYDNKLYSGVLQDKTGYGLDSSEWNASTSSGGHINGRTCLRGNSTMVDAVKDKKMLMTGLWWCIYQSYKSSERKDYFFTAWDAKPMFSRYGMDANYKAILPYDRYPFDEACNGYMSIAGTF